MNLPNDVARCNGIYLDGQWREGCEICLRRTSKTSGGFVVRMDQPPITVFECDFLIKPEEIGDAL